MSKRFRVLAPALAGLALAGLDLTASAANAQTAPPEGPGKSVVEQKCGACHELSRVTRAGCNEAGWRNTVHMMVNIGAQLSPQALACSGVNKVALATIR